MDMIEQREDCGNGPPFFIFYSSSISLLFTHNSVKIVTDTLTVILTYSLLFRIITPFKVGRMLKWQHPKTSAILTALQR